MDHIPAFVHSGAPRSSCRPPARAFPCGPSIEQRRPKNESTSAAMAARDEDYPTIDFNK